MLRAYCLPFVLWALYTKTLKLFLGKEVIQLFSVVIRYVQFKKDFNEIMASANKSFGQHSTQELF